MIRRSQPAPAADAPPLAASAPRTTTLGVEFAGLRLDQALARLYPAHSRTRLQQWIAGGHVDVDGHAALPRLRIAGGEVLAVRPPAPVAATFDAPEAIALAVVHEDAALLVIDKPAGLVVHPGSGHREGTLLNALLHHAPALANLERAGIVHRLDKDTSGLMVVAKTPEAQTSLTRQIAARTVRRQYLALAWGRIEQPLTVDAPIGRHPTERTSMAVVASGRAARTHVEPLADYGVATLVQCTLDTGRTHQIRVHMTAIRHPLLGDPAYGARRTLPGIMIPPRQALHAWKLALAHPATGREMRWRADPPADFAQLRDALAARAAALSAERGDDGEDDDA
ncbi:MAG: RluA family pseudouridine synthase [Proteobacteria bacterium]|nr:RluA family pseudouridine synthase [Pseudomonadota bacterium]